MATDTQASGGPQRVLAGIREALIPGPEGLDVERLARAMARAELTSHAPDEAEDHWPSYEEAAEKYAAEYDRLATGPEYVVERGHNHTTAGLPTYPVFREACPLGCDALRAGEIAANTGRRPNLAVVDPFAEVAAMRALDAIEAEAAERALRDARERVAALPMTFGQHTCWDDHEGPDAEHPHLDGTPCHDRIVNESVSRAAALRALGETP